MNVSSHFEMSNMDTRAVKDEIELPAGRLAWERRGIVLVGTGELEVFHEILQLDLSGKGVEITCY